MIGKHTIHNDVITASVEALELVLDHIDVALLVLQPFLLDRLVARLDDFHLPDVLLPSALQTALQEIPEDEVHQAINQKDCPEDRLGEHTHEAIVSLQCEVHIDLVGPSGLEHTRRTEAYSANHRIPQHGQHRGNYHLPLVHCRVELPHRDRQVSIEEHQQCP